MSGKTEKPQLTESQRTQVKELAGQVLSSIEHWSAAFQKQRIKKLPDGFPFDTRDVDRLVAWLVKAGWVPEAKQLRDQCRGIVSEVIGLIEAMFLSKQRLRKEEVQKVMAESGHGKPPAIWTHEQRQLQMALVYGRVFAMQTTLRGVLPLLANKPTGSSENGEAMEKRSWTQTQVDAAIREHAKTNSAKPVKLGKNIKQDRAGAVDKARQVFGRNTLSRHLKCPAAMVSNSQPWKAIADMLGLRGRRPGVGRGDKVGFDKAIAQAGYESWKATAAQEQD